MIKSEVNIPLHLNNEVVTLSIYGENNIVEIEETEALANGEAKYQIKEGNLYEYKVSEGYF